MHFPHSIRALTAAVLLRATELATQMDLADSKSGRLSRAQSPAVNAATARGESPADAMMSLGRSASGSGISTALFSSISDFSKLQLSEDDEEYPFILLAKSYFDLREYDRAAHLLRSRDEARSGGALFGARGSAAAVTAKRPPHHLAQFLRLYSMYLVSLRLHRQDGSLLALAHRAVRSARRTR